MKTMTPMQEKTASQPARLVSDQSVAVIGAGPIGLAAATHLLSHNLNFSIFESSATIAGNLETVRHVRLFSPWDVNVDPLAAQLLREQGWRMPPSKELPTAGAFIDQYLAPLARLPQIAEHLQLKSRVLHVTREAYNKVRNKNPRNTRFILHVETPRGIELHRAAAILDASGTWHHPNPIGEGGVPAIGEQEASAHIRYGMPDILGVQRRRYAGKRTLVVGAGHSAAGNLLALAELGLEAAGTEIHWAIRGSRRRQGFDAGKGDDKLPARETIERRLEDLLVQEAVFLHEDFKIREMRMSNSGVTVVASDGRRIENVNEIIGATGARPDWSMVRELATAVDPNLECSADLAPLIDPTEHSCRTVAASGAQDLEHPEHQFYAIGAKSYGRAPNFLLSTGYGQVRSVIQKLAIDLLGTHRTSGTLAALPTATTSAAPRGCGNVVSCCAPSCETAEPSFQDRRNDASRAALMSEPGKGQRIDDPRLPCRAGRNRRT